MQHYFATIDTLNDFSELLKYSAQVCREMGVIRQSYHLTPQFDSPNSTRVAVYADGFSEEWLELYDEADFRRSDPIPGRVMRAGTILKWTDAMKAGPNTADNIAYFKAMKKEGLIHGFGIPLFGPRGRDAYASFDFGIPLEDVAQENIGTVRAVPQAAHQKLSILLDSMAIEPELSERELEVLQWMTRGKSMAATALILDLSRDTVKTYVKRIYAKLEVSDRVGATVSALKLGLIQI